MVDLEQLLADWRSDAQALRRQGIVERADWLDQRADEVKASAIPWLTWLSEKEAMLKSGLTQKWFRIRFSGWLDVGLARWDGKNRQFRDCVVPQRKHRSAVREDAKREARGAA